MTTKSSDKKPASISFNGIITIIFLLFQNKSNCLTTAKKHGVAFRPGLQLLKRFCLLFHSNIMLLQLVSQLVMTDTIRPVRHAHSMPNVAKCSHDTLAILLYINTSEKPPQESQNCFSTVSCKHAVGPTKYHLYLQAINGGLHTSVFLLHNQSNEAKICHQNVRKSSK